MKNTVIAENELANYDIALSSDGKNIDAATGWGKITADGVKVQDMTTPGKAGKNVFMVRVAPNLNAGSYAAGSKAKKVTATTIIKAPTYKIDYKKGLIKPKEGAIYEKLAAPLGKDDTAAFVDAVAPKTAFTKESAKAGLDLATPDLYGETLVFRTTGGKKAVSAIQTVTVAPPANLYYDDVAKLSVVKGKLKMDKTFEAVDKNDGTGKKVGKDAAAGYIRIKNTAKYNAKTDTTTGEPASRFIEFKFTMGNIGSDARPKDGAVGIEPVIPNQDGVVAAENLLPDEVIAMVRPLNNPPALDELVVSPSPSVISQFIVSTADAAPVLADLDFDVSGVDGIPKDTYLELKAGTVSVGDATNAASFVIQAKAALEPTTEDIEGTLATTLKATTSGALKESVVFSQTGTREISMRVPAV